VYVAFPVPAGRGADAVRAVPALGLAGLNVTMPHKADAAHACDDLSDDARALGVVNTVVPCGDDRVHGDSTDGPGFVAALHDEGVDPRGRAIVVIGAGGAARAIVLALGRAGARVTVAARRPEARDGASALAPVARAVALHELDAVVRDADVIVNATPIGMRGEPPPFDVASLRAPHVVVDTVYHPAETPLLAAARAAGVAVAVNGLGMLVHQAALAFRLMTGLDAPLDAMRAAVAEVR
jgi:shikimate dehydrogenase